MTLRVRFALAAALAVAGAITLLAVIAYVAERREVVRAADGDLHREAVLIASDLVEPRAEVPPGVDVNVIRSYELIGQVVGRDGQVAPLRPGDPTLPVGEQVEAVVQGAADRFLSDAVVEGTTYRTLTVPAPPGALVIGRSMADVEGHMRDYLVALAVVVLAGFGVSIVLGNLVALAALRPITRLSEAARKLASERTLRHRLEVRGKDEVASLSRSLNQMLATVAAASRSKSQLVADASHELRTPLTTIWADVDLIGDERLDDREREQLRTDVLAELAGLVTAVDDLLELARDQQVDSVRDDVSLDGLLTEVVHVAERHWLSVHFRLRTVPVTVHADRAQLTRAFANLVDNAAKWSPPDGEVEVTLTEDAVEVRDHGPGIPEADLPRVFERFYRTARARGLPGSGLGLAIVQKAVEEHGWTVTAHNAEGGGTLLRVELGRPHPAGLSDDDLATDAEPARPRSLVPALPWRAVAVGALVLGSGVLFLVLRQDGPELTGVSPDLVTLSGELDRCGGQYCVGGEIVDFGPTWYVRDTLAPHDYDDDGFRLTIGEELAGLLGTDIRLETDGGAIDQDVFTIEGRPYRDVHGQLPAPEPAPDAGRAGTLSAA